MAGLPTIWIKVIDKKSKQPLSGIKIKLSTTFGVDLPDTLGKVVHVTDKSGEVAFILYPNPLNPSLQVKIFDPDLKYWAPYGSQFKMPAYLIGTSNAHIQKYTVEYTRYDPELLASAKACGGEVCGEDGLSILPVRATPVIAKNSYPKLPELFSKNIPEAKGSAQNILRTLRAGYLYVFNDNRGRWDAYIVSKEGFYQKIINDQTQKTVSTTTLLAKCRQPITPFSCKGNSCHAGASVIRVKGDKLTTIYLKFSDVEWTADTFKTMHDKRATLMSAFNASSWLDSKGKDQANACSFTQIDSVFEFAKNAPHYAKETTFERHNKSKLTEVLKIREQQLVKNSQSKKPSAIVAVADPVGALMELNALMQLETKRFYETIESDTELWTAHTIKNLEPTLRNYGKTDYIRQDIEMQKNVYDLAGPGGRGMAPSDEKLLEISINERITQQGLNGSEEKQWKKHFKEVNEAKFKSAQGKITTKEKQSNGTIAALAECFCAWWNLNSTHNYFAHIFSPTEPEHIKAMIAAVYKCIEDTADITTCAAQYEKDLNNTNSILWKTFTLNAPKIQEKIFNPPGAMDKVDASFWSGAFSAYSEITGNKATDIEIYMAKTSFQLGGIISKILNTSQNTSAANNTNSIVNKLLFALGMHSKSPVGLFYFEGTQAQVYEAFLEKTFNHVDKVNNTQSKPNKPRGQNVLNQQLKIIKKQLGGDYFNKTTKKFSFYATFDAAKAAGITQSNRIIKINEYMKIVPHDVAQTMKQRRFMAPTAGLIFNTAFIGLAFAGMNDNVASTQIKEIKARAWGLAIGSFGGIIETTSTALKALSPALVKTQMSTDFVKHSFNKVKLLTITGKFLGAIGGFISAYYDGKNAFSNFSKGRPILFFLYSGSGILGGFAATIITIQAVGALIGSATLASFGAALLGPIFVLLVLIAVLIIIFDDSTPLSDWLNECPLGKNPSNSRPLKVLKQDFTIAEQKMLGTK